MPMDEWMRWFEYLRLRPVGWREDHRTYMIMSALGVKEKPDKIFSSLAQMKKAEEKWNDAQQNMGSLRNSQLLSLLSSATGGDKLDFLYEED